MRLLRILQTIRLGTLSFGGAHHRTVMTEIPADLEETLKKLKLQKLLSAPPAWARPAL